MHSCAVRTPAQRHGYTLRSPRLEEFVHAFESILATMLEIAAFASRVKTLGLEIMRVTRRTRVPEERVLPRLRAEIRPSIQYLGESDRETQPRLRNSKCARGGDERRHRPLPSRVHRAVEHEVRQ